MSKRAAAVFGAWLLVAAHAGCSEGGPGSPDVPNVNGDSGVVDVLEPAADSGTGPTDAGAGPDSGVGSVDGGMGGFDGRAGDCTGDIICDDFEQDSLGATPADWQVVIDPQDAGTVLVDGTHTFSGTKAVHFTLAPANSIPHVQMLGKISLPTNEFFGRMMVWMAPYVPTPPHWNLIEGWGYMPGSVTHTIYDQGMYEYGGVCSPEGGLGAAYLGPKTDCCQPSDAAVPMSHWACVEWQFDGIKNEYHFWLDGQAIDSLTVTASPTQCGGVWHAPVFERVDLGFGGGSPNYATSHEMWIDDVGIASTRIGCPAPTAGTH
jgi:hypothetical protein